MDKPIYTIYAGVNGAGKSSLYYTDPHMAKQKRVNVDEMVQKLGDWRENKVQIEASKQAVREIKENIEKGISFNQETTLSGKSVISHIKKAKEHNFSVHLNYVGLDSAELAKQRVKSRVEKGGHGIPEELIEKRYTASLENLKEVLPLCDVIRIHDNTEVYKEVAYLEKGVVLHNENCVWLNPILQEYENNRVSAQIRQGGYKPTQELIKDMKQLNYKFEKELSVKEVKEYYKNSGSLNQQKKKLIDKAAEDFIQAEKEMLNQKEPRQMKPPCPEP